MILTGTGLGSQSISPKSQSQACLVNNCLETVEKNKWRILHYLSKGVDREHLKLN